MGRHTCGLSGSGCGVGGWYIGCWRSVRTVEKAARDDLEVCILVARVIVDNIVLDIVYFAIDDGKERAFRARRRDKEITEVESSRPSFCGGTQHSRLPQVDQVFSKGGKGTVYTAQLRTSAICYFPSLPPRSVNTFFACTTRIILLPYCSSYNFLHLQSIESSKHTSLTMVYTFPDRPNLKDTRLIRNQ